MLVLVHNGSGINHADRFDGKDYTFPPDSDQTIPYEAAVHIFGYGLKDRAHQITRLGWAPTSAQWVEAIKRLDAFEIVQVDEEEDVPVHEVAVQKLEQPTNKQIIDPDLVPLKPRTQSILRKAS